ncbi:hypothetical protein DVH24_041093, partial [Malus domestica]
KRGYDQTFIGNCSRSCYSNFPVFLCGFPYSLSSSIILRDEYDFVKFIKMVQQASLFVNLQIGLYVCAEWNFGIFCDFFLSYVNMVIFITLCFVLFLKQGIPSLAEICLRNSFSKDNEPFKVGYYKSSVYSNTT